MKKLSTLLMVIAMVTMLITYGTRNQAPAEPAPVETAEPVVQTSNEPTSTTKTFGIKTVDAVSQLQKVFSGFDGPNAFDSEPKTLENPATENVPAFTTYTYIVTDGVYLYINESADTKEMMSIYLMGKADAMPKESINILCAYTAILIKHFEPDDYILTKVEGKLDLANTCLDVGREVSSVGTKAIFSYSYDGTWSILDIHPW